MKRRNPATVIFPLIFLALLSCARAPSKGSAAAKALPKGKTFTVFIVMDTVDDWSSGVRDGFAERLDELLAAAGSKAAYEIADTKLDPSTADSIRARIEAGKPDLVCEINYPSGFADSMIASKLKGPDYRFVSMNAVPVQSGAIDSWARPGGNVCGAGVFVQLNSALKLVKRVDPGIKRVFSYSWSEMKDINAWWEPELKRACAEEGLEFAEFRRISSAREEIALLDSFAKGPAGTAIMPCISAYAEEDGTPVNLDEFNAAYHLRLQKTILSPYVSYEDVVIEKGALLGACVIWKDLGTQMADLGARVLSGEDPGSIPWEYPRKFNIVINKKTADRLGISIPPEVMNAAYRIYTDYEGGFMGKAD